ncbi:tetratricopeptide repeat protein [Thiovibrio sp. JS02]
MKNKSFLQAVVLFFFVSFCTFITTGAAESFPFRAISPGERIPDVKVAGLAAGKEIALRPPQNRPALLVFWGADLPTKKERSILALRQIRELLPFLAEKKVDLLIVNAQGDAQAVVNEVVSSSGMTEPVYIDQEQKAYGALGIFVMPSLLLLDKDGTAVAGLGYSKEMKQRLQGEIEIMLGEKTRAQVDAELNPTMSDKSKEDKDATRHLNLGKVMRDKGQLESAQHEFQQAIALNPKLGEAYIEMGCVSVELGKLEEGQDALDKGLDLLPGGSLAGEICSAQIKAAKGSVDEALDDLQPLVFRNNRNPQLHYAIGSFHAAKGKHQEAAQEFRKAYELLAKQQEHEQ